MLSNRWRAIYIGKGVKGVERLDWIFKGFVATSGAVGMWLFGGWTQVFNLLLLLVVADFISGLAAAQIEGKKDQAKALCSKACYAGIAKKVGLFIVIAIAHQLDGILGSGHGLRDATVFFYIANELLSIVENAGRIGLPLPPKIKQVITLFKEKEEQK